MPKARPKAEKGPRLEIDSVPAGWECLSPRERECCWLEKQGHDAAESAKILGIADTSVRVYLTTARKKLGGQKYEDGVQAPPELEIPGARVSMAEILASIEQKVRIALRSMDKERFADAKLRDLSQMVKDLMHTRSLILGEPTQIIRTEERMTLNQLVPLLLAEAKRRGLEIGLTDEGVSVGRPKTIEADVA